MTIRPFGPLFSRRCLLIETGISVQRRNLCLSPPSFNLCSSSPSLLQSAVMRTGHRVPGRRMANGSSKHKHVSKNWPSWHGQEIIHPLLRFTYEIAPIFILMEHVVLKKMREIIGFLDGDSILAPGRICRPASLTLTEQLSSFSFCVSLPWICGAGGAISNLYAVMIARHKLFPDYKEKGLKSLPQLVLFTSEHVSLTQQIISCRFCPLLVPNCLPES